LIGKLQLIEPGTHLKRCRARCLGTYKRDTIAYTVVGVFYVDQILGMTQRVHRTTAGIVISSDPTNLDEAHHEEMGALHE